MTMTTDGSFDEDGSFDKDDKILDELKAQNIEGLTARGKFAINQLAEKDQGEVIFLILSLNSRLRELEASIDGSLREATEH
jgi:hypothetical protein